MVSKNTIMVLWKSTFASIINHDVTWAHHLKVIMINTQIVNTLYYIAGKNDKMDPKTILSRINTYLFTMRITLAKAEIIYP